MRGRLSQPVLKARLMAKNFVMLANNGSPGSRESPPQKPEQFNATFDNNVIFQSIH